MAPARSYDGGLFLAISGSMELRPSPLTSVSPGGGGAAMVPAPMRNRRVTEVTTQVTCF